MAEVSYAAAAFGFWAKNAEKYLDDERVKTASPFVKGRKLIVRYVPRRGGRRDRPLELPADELVRRLHPRDGRGQRGHPEAERGHAADRAADGRVRARVRGPRGRLPGGARLRRDRRRADRRRRLRHVHRVDGDRQEGDGAGRADAHSGGARAGRQGPDARAAPTPTSSGPRTPRCTTRCRTPGRRASRPSACTWRRRSTTSSSRSCPTGCGRCARARRAGRAASTSARSSTRRRRTSSRRT